MRCKHGEMKEVKGFKNGKAWAGFFCPTPKNTPDQCPPVWPRKDEETPRTAPQAHTPVPSPNTASDALLVEVLKEVKAIKAMVTSLVNEPGEGQGPSGEYKW